MASLTSENLLSPSVLIGALVAVTVAAFGTPAGAAAAPPPPEVAAQSKLVEGVKLLKEGDYSGALARFKDAYRLVPSPKIHYDFGLAYVGLDRPVAALEAFERFLAEALDAPADKREKAEHNRALLLPRVAALRISADLEGAEVLIDGQSRGTTPLLHTIYLDPGPHRIVARLLGGGTDHVESIEAAGGQRLDLALRLKEPLVARVRPPVTVALQPTATPAQVTLPAATTQGREQVPPAKPERSRWKWALSSAVFGVVLLGAGATFGLLAKRESDSVSRDSRTGAQFVPANETRGTTYQTLQIISLTTGTIATAAGALLFATGLRRPTSALVETKTAVRRAPWSTWTLIAGPSPAGAGLGIAF